MAAVLLAERFERHVDRSGDCHVWTGSICKSTGYGQINDGGTCRGAHVVALELKLGRRLRPKMQALHTCDNRPCVNGNHLYEGTQKQNIADAIARGRFVPPPLNDMDPPIHYGEDNCKTVMTVDTVRSLRRTRIETGASYQALARQYGISTATVAQIVTGRTWKGVMPYDHR